MIVQRNHTRQIWIGFKGFWCDSMHPKQVRFMANLVAAPVSRTHALIRSAVALWLYMCSRYFRMCTTRRAVGTQCGWN